MSSKLLETLPLKKIREKYDDVNISLEQINKKYEETLELIKRICYINRLLHDEDDIDYGPYIEISAQRSFIQIVHAPPDKESAHYLKKYTFNANSQIIFDRQNDIITAFYIPEELEYVELDNTHHHDLIAYYDSSYEDQILENILAESKTLPLQHDKTRLEHILWLSKKENEYTSHNQDTEIYIDGKLYKRVLLLQPCINLCSCQFSKFYLRAEQKYSDLSLYVEFAVLSCDVRQTLMSQDTYYYAPSTNKIYRDSRNGYIENIHQ